MQARTKARGWALRVLYAWEARGNPPLVPILEEFLLRRHIATDRRAYLRRVVETIAQHQGDIDAAIEGSLTNWRLGRLTVIDRIVLRIAAAEMLYMDDIPPRVSIQEAIALAERYGTDNSPRFVNGVLDALMKRTQRE